MGVTKDLLDEIDSADEALKRQKKKLTVEKKCSCGNKYTFENNFLSTTRWYTTEQSKLWFNCNSCDSTLMILNKDAQEKKTTKL